MSMAEDIAAIKVEIGHLKDRLDRIDDRLAAGDKRFKDQELAHAEERGVRRVAMMLGTMALTAAGALGMWALSQAPTILKWIIAK